MVRQSAYCMQTAIVCTTTLSTSSQEIRSLCSVNKRKHLHNMLDRENVIRVIPACSMYKFFPMTLPLNHGYEHGVSKSNYEPYICTVRHWFVALDKQSNEYGTRLVFASAATAWRNPGNGLKIS